MNRCGHEFFGAALLSIVLPASRVRPRSQSSGWQHASAWQNHSTGWIGIRCPDRDRALHYDEHADVWTILRDRVARATDKLTAQRSAATISGPIAFRKRHRV